MRVKSVNRDSEWCRTTIWFEDKGITWSRDFYDNMLHDEITMRNWLNSLIEDVKLRT
jgi:hypothetical protein